MKPAAQLRSSSVLGLEIDRMLLERGWTMTSLATKTDYPQSGFSRLIGGAQRFITEDHLPRIINTLATNDDEKARLVAAHLIDHRTGLPGADLVEISIKGQTAAAPTTELDDALAFLSDKARQVRSVGELIILLARNSGMPTRTNTYGFDRPAGQRPAAKRKKTK